MPHGSFSACLCVCEAVAVQMWSARFASPCQAFLGCAWCAWIMAHNPLQLPDFNSICRDLGWLRRGMLDSGLQPGHQAYCGRLWLKSFHVHKSVQCTSSDITANMQLAVRNGAMCCCKISVDSSVGCTMLVHTRCLPVATQCGRLLLCQFHNSCNPMKHRSANSANC